MFNQSAFQISRFIRTSAVACLLGLLALQAHAETYYFGGGNWTDQGSWAPSYPGTTVAAADQIILDNPTTINDDVTIWGKITVNAPLSLSEYQMSTLNVGGEFVNNSTITIHNNGTMNLLNFSNNSRLEILSGGHCENAGNFYNNPSATLKVFGGGSFSSTGGHFMNLGTLDAKGGANLGNNKAQFHVKNAGKLEVHGVMQLGDPSKQHQSPFLLTDQGSVTIGIAGGGGPGAPNGHDKLQLAGPATFTNPNPPTPGTGNGQIVITLSNGYQPGANQEFQVMSWTTPPTGQPNVVAPPGYTAQTNMTPTGLTVTLIKP